AGDLKWLDRYGEARSFYRASEAKPIMIVPLIAGRGTLGVIKFMAKIDQQPFDRTDEDLAVIAARFLANAIDQAKIIQQQSVHIRQLVEMGAKQDAQQLFEAVTDRLSSMLGAHSQLYLRAKGGSEVRLIVENGRRVDQETSIARGNDLIGWVFKTGKRLSLPDAQAFMHGERLADVDLDRISDGAVINDDDRFLKSDLIEVADLSTAPLPFLGVPVKTHDGSILGVLCAQALSAASQLRQRSFDRDEVQLAQAFASAIALAINNDRARRLGDLLMQVGFQADLDKLFDLIVQQVPLLVAGTGCSIYLAENVDAPCLRLARSSRAGLSDADRAKAITYQYGEGKTGFCALARATLVVNHFGVGAASQIALKAERTRLQARQSGDLIENLLDDQKQLVGLIQLRRGLSSAAHVQQKFTELAQQLLADRVKGLPTAKKAEFDRAGSKASWSFIAVPIQIDAAELFGVITIGRPIDQSPFFAEDVALVESIAGRLAAIMRNLKTQDDQKRLLMSLAHEINTPLQGVMADTENLKEELPAGSELKQLAGHTLEQVQKLHLLTETIMTVLSGQAPERALTIHSLYRPLKEACQMFESEAAAKGCDILDPRAIGSRFPDIEMSLFDLTIAFKNLIHNAIKYSFKPPQKYAGQRYVRITGQWADPDRQAYAINIENYGVGIPPEEIDSRLIFRPYYRGAKASDRRRTGAGLGLAQVRQIIEEMHHGSIGVTSKPVVGEAHLTTFTVTLPVRQPKQ
ncbi:MAG TPA: GAF domain-containing protein, partial [Anaerolineae bacterium]|nr:GAF domain-containing protein [Anaerolineae bacterium]